ncbi:hypothetical protein QCA50_010713 [Cerrena zonata]|uniref:Uncharacterized protein n=1 Tax=Cerrena zonata TaxID=2478898 RepID=A0AAW0G8E2_9APHY
MLLHGIIADRTLSMGIKQRRFSTNQLLADTGSIMVFIFHRPNIVHVVLAYRIQGYLLSRGLFYYSFLNVPEDRALCWAVEHVQYTLTFTVSLLLQQLEPQICTGYVQTPSRRGSATRRNPSSNSWPPFQVTQRPMNIHTLLCIMEDYHYGGLS